MTDDWVAAPEDAVAYWFSQEVGHPIESLVVLDTDDETMTASINWVERAQELPDGDLTEDVDWVSSAGIGRKEIHIPSVFEALELHESDLGECDRDDCRASADQFVLWATAYWESGSEAVSDVQQYCDRHVPLSCPFHRGGTTTGVDAPGFGWSPGKS
ncbi:hypothetical protein [Halobacterium yunchengense]|uniref:hypothetical protein n=1 Tax=Halobacterium yunchengense TaxID=3108497 RepID=UPI00300B49CE